MKNNLVAAIIASIASGFGIGRSRGDYGSLAVPSSYEKRPDRQSYTPRGPRKPLDYRMIAIKRRRRIRNANGGTLPKKYRRA